MPADVTRTRTPIEPSRAAIGLAQSTDREEIFELLLRAARFKTRFAAWLSVHDDHIRGRMALAEPAFDSAEVHRLRIARHTVPALEAAIASGAATVGPIATGEPFIDNLLDAIGGTPKTTLVLPIAVKGRIPALLVAHRGKELLTLAEVDDVVALAGAMEAALIRAAGKRQRRPSMEYDQIELSFDADRVAKLRAQVEQHRRDAAWAPLAEALRALVDEGQRHGDPDEEQQLELLLELGHVEIDRLGRWERAVEAWRRAEAIDGSDLRVVHALDEAFEERGAWHDWFELLERRLALTDSRPQRIAMLHEAGGIASAQLADHSRAIDCYERILALDADDIEAIRALLRLYEAREQWDKLEALLARARMLPACDVEMLQTIARQYEDKLGDVTAAVRTHIAILRQRPDPDGVATLDRLVRELGSVDDVLDDCERLASELEARSLAVAAHALWRAIARWVREQNRVDRALEKRALERALSAIDDDTTRADLIDVLRALERWPAVATHLEKRVEKAPDAAKRAELHAELGELYETHLDDPTRAIEQYKRAAAEQPEPTAATAALVALHRLYLATDAWADLAVLLPRLIEALDVVALDVVAPASVLVDLYLELGTVLADRLGQPASAVHAFTKALSLEPKNALALAGLEQAYRASGQSSALLELEETKLDNAGADAKPEQYVELATAWQDRERFERAIGCWRKALARDPKHAAAHDGLAHALRSDRQWSALVAARQAQLAITDDAKRRAALLVEIAEVSERELDDTNAAIDAYRDILKREPAHRAAFEALRDLYVRHTMPKRAVELLEQRLEATTVPSERAALYVQLGRLHSSLRDTAKARLAFVGARAIDPDDPQILEGLASVHAVDGELSMAADELEKAAKLYRERGDRVRCLVEAAGLYRRLSDSTRARQCMQQVLELDADHAEAERTVIELLADAKDWKALWPHLERVAHRLERQLDAAPTVRLEMYLRAAKCAVELERFDKAVELFDRACALDPSPATLLARADALHRSNAVDKARAAYEDILQRHAAALVAPDIARVHHRLAAMAADRKDLRAAEEAYRKALEKSPDDRAMLGELAEVQLSANDYRAAIASLSARAALEPPPERVATLARIGALYRDRLADADKAIATYREALAYDEGNRRILLALLELYTSNGRWTEALETIDRFLAVETGAAKRASYHLASAEIRRVELGDPIGAVEHYERALDELWSTPTVDDATRKRSFETFALVAELHAASGNWKSLAQSYRRMIKRLPKDAPELLRLWDDVAELYRTRLDHRQTAMEAFEIAHALDPDKSEQRAQLLADLYASSARGESGIVERAWRLVETNPASPHGYRALFATCQETGRMDAAWCAARALRFLGKADAEQDALYRQFDHVDRRKPNGILDEDCWNTIRIADEDRIIGAIFVVIKDALLASRAGPPKSFELRSKDHIEADSPRAIAKAFRHAARVLNVPVPDLYVQPQRPGRLLLATCLDHGRIAPAVAVCRDLASGFSETEIAAAVGALLAHVRPSYYLKLALPTAGELEAALFAAARIGGKPLARAESDPRVANFSAELKAQLSPTAVEALSQLVARLPAQVDLARWRQAVEAATNRAALLVSSELAATARMMAVDAPAGATARRRVHELVAFSVSPSYLELRRHLLVNVEHKRT